MQLIFKKDQLIRVSMIAASSGTSVTGLTNADVTCYYSKVGAATAELVLNVSNFTETDATNMPGVYSVEIPASVTDTLGELVLSFNGGSFDQYLIRGIVYDDDLNGIAANNTLIDTTNTNVLNVDGDIVTLSGDVAALSADVVSLTSDVADLSSDILGFNTQLSANGAGITAIQGSGFDTGTDSLAVLRGDFDTRIPEEAALARHLGDGTGTIDAPTNVGIWDALGDGSASISEIALDTKRMLGLAQENYRISDQTYDSNDNLVSAVIKIYPSKADLEGDTNVLATYVMASSYDTANRLTSYQVTKQ